MRKFAAISSAFAVLLGVVGFFLRRTELNSIFDPQSGLALRFAGISLALGGLTVAVLAALLVSLLVIGALKVRSGFSGAFGSASSVPVFVVALGAVFFAAGALALLARVFKAPAFSIVNGVLAIFGLASAISVFVVFYCSYKLRDGSELQLCSIVPIAFLCFWLILAYRQRAADPVLLDYIYEILALILCILGFYFTAGFAFGRVKPRRALFCTNGAIYMSIVTLADSHPLPQMLFFVGSIIVMLVCSILLASNCEKM